MSFKYQCKDCQRPREFDEVVWHPVNGSFICRDRLDCAKAKEGDDEGRRAAP